MSKKQQIFLKETPKDINDLISKFFVRGLLNSRFGASHYMGAITYSDKECTIIQCELNKIRSFDDFLLCVYTYFPKMELKDIVHSLILTTFKQDDVIFQPQFQYCNDIKKITIYFSFSQMVYFEEVLKYDSQYSWQELLKLLNINNREELLQYIKNNKNETK